MDRDYTIHPIIRQIVNRDCHVGWNNRQVIAHVISRLKRKYATFKAMPPADRKEMMRQCIAQHADNRTLYSNVVNGRI
jgi:hypothetical protein